MIGCFPPGLTFIALARRASAANAACAEELSNAKTPIAPGCVFSKTGIAFSATCKLIYQINFKQFNYCKL
jgi:hypothetical protein